MTTRSPSANRKERAYALVTVMFLTGASLVFLAGAMSWTTNTGRLNDRNTAYFANSTAGEAASEKVIATMSQDYLSSGETNVYANLANYRLMVPKSTESDYWSNFQFSDGSGNVDRTAVSRLTNWAFGDIPSKYTGVRGSYATYRVISAVKPLSYSFKQPTTTLQQDLVLASIPISQYQYFYAMDMEITPDVTTTISGRIHCNGNIYLQPDKTLTLQAHVTASSDIIHDKSPNDPVVRSPGTIVYRAQHDAKARNMKLPVGTNSTADILHALIEIPPASESATSLLGQQRYYNKADLVILVSSNSVKATSGSYNNFATTISATVVNTFLTTNTTFYDMRESRDVRPIDIDVGKFNLQTNALKLALGRDPKTVFIARTVATDVNSFSAVRLVNCATVPMAGFTVATPHPLYTKGHFNTQGSNTGTTNTTKAYAVSVAADAVTFLSASWNDNQGGSDLSARTGASTTVNTTILTGIVPTGNGYYSGGIDNCIRLLEDWSGKTLTWNGAIAILFDSRTATAPWGTSANVYDVPTRKWGWDLDLATQAKLPPSTPEVRTILHNSYVTTQSASSQ